MLLNFSNGASVNIRGAENFTFSVGGNRLSNIEGEIYTFDKFVTDILKLPKVPADGEAPIVLESGNGMLGNIEIGDMNNYADNEEINLAKGLVAYYKFDGNAKDSSGNENNGIEYGDVKYTNGVVGQAFDAKFENKAHLQLEKTFDTNILQVHSLLWEFIKYGKHDLRR